MVKDRVIRWLPLVWLVGGSLLTAASFSAGTISVYQVAENFGYLGLATAAYLSLVIADRRQTVDLLVVLGYACYGLGFGLLSHSYLFGVIPWPAAERAVAVIILGLSPAIAWVAFTRGVMTRYWQRDQQERDDE